ncbi:hypothetical protein STRAU_7037 [Streptomyces aurantiacus JA 4570]|uniref:Uncharacterized protein n=1 Tax=Streptomyces aurantiacus JA 4570 TaxID=1286094 RepID=S3ZBC0_9ACTN|nr:hypothetical protein STRAU_7037 [Streptomyces aurantiacus JA 4570]
MGPPSHFALFPLSSCGVRPLGHFTAYAKADESSPWSSKTQRSSPWLLLGGVSDDGGNGRATVRFCPGFCP